MDASLATKRMKSLCATLGFVGYTVQVIGVLCFVFSTAVLIGQLAMDVSAWAGFIGVAIGIALFVLGCFAEWLSLRGYLIIYPPDPKSPSSHKSPKVGT